MIAAGILAIVTIALILWARHQAAIASANARIARRLHEHRREWLEAVEEAERIVREYRSPVP